MKWKVRHEDRLFWKIYFECSFFFFLRRRKTEDTGKREGRWKKKKDLRVFERRKY